MLRSEQFPPLGIWYVITNGRDSAVTILKIKEREHVRTLTGTLKKGKGYSLLQGICPWEKEDFKFLFRGL